MFEEVKPGEKLWSSLKGWGTVAINEDNGSQGYFLGMVFLGCLEKCFYLLDGRRSRDDLFPELYWSEIHFDIPPKPKKKIKKTVEGWVDLKTSYEKSDPTMTYFYNFKQSDNFIPATLTFEIEE